MIRLTTVSKVLSTLLVPLQSGFSSKSGNTDLWLSANAQRAIWATAVVRKISLAKGSDEIMDQSLREQLLNMKHPSQSFQNKQYRQQYLELKTPQKKQIIFQESFRKEILSIFSDGVDLSTNVFSQGRISQGKDQFRMPNHSYQKRFVFCPNALVTQPVFDAILKTGQNFLMYGGFGISKTVSLVLFNYLSCIINKYEYDCFQDKLLSQENIFLKKNYLNLQIPKIFYWSLRMQDNFNSLKQIIIAQASQLPQQQKIILLGIQSFQEFVDKVRQKYTYRNINTQAFIDQINVLASKFRQFNHFLKSLQNKQEKWPKQQQQIIQKIQSLSKQNKTPKIQWQIKKQNQRLAKIEKQKVNMQKQKIQNQKIQIQGQTLKQRMKKFGNIGQKIIYNSSINIQQDLTTSYKSFPQQKLMELTDGHIPLPIIQIRYFQNLAKKWGCNQLSHFFWFQMYRKLKHHPLFQHKSQLSQLKTIFYEEARDQKWPLYVRLVNITYMFKTDKKRWFGESVNTNFSKGKFRQTTKEIIKQIPESSIDEYREKLRRFVDKQIKLEDKDNSIMFLHLMLELAKSYDQESTQNLKVQIFKVKKQTIRDQLQKYLDHSYVNKQLFSYQYSPVNPTITFLWTPKQLVYILKPIVYDQTIKAWNLDRSLTKELLIENKAVLGHYLQASILRVLKQKDITFYFQSNSYKFKQGADRYYIDQKKQEQFLIYQTSTFQQFNQSTNPYTSIHQNLEKMKILAAENPTKFICGSPVISKGGLTVHSTQSASFDLALIQYKQPNTYRIITIDLTVSKNKYKKIRQFWQKFKTKFSCFLQPQTNPESQKYQYQHIIIGNKIPLSYKQCKYKVKIGLIKSINFIPQTKDEQTNRLISYFNYIRNIDLSPHPEQEEQQVQQ